MSSAELVNPLISEKDFMERIGAELGISQVGCQ